MKNRIGMQCRGLRLVPLKILAVMTFCFLVFAFQNSNAVEVRTTNDVRTTKFENISLDPINSRRPVEFKNTFSPPDSIATDLHVELEGALQRGVESSTPFTGRWDEVTVPPGRIWNFYPGVAGESVPPGDVAKIVFIDHGKIIIKKWWWTTGGDHQSRGTQLGPVYTKEKNIELISFIDEPATGDGIFLASISGVSDTFHTTAGQSRAQTLEGFCSFLDGFVQDGDTLISHFPESDSSVIFVGNLLGDPADSLHAEILVQDSTQDIFFYVMPPSCDYLPGDINGDGQRGGGDVTYGVRFFKLIGNRPPDSCYNDAVPTPSHWLYVAADVNGNCEFRGSDITRLVAYFKLIAPLQYCYLFPPAPMKGDNGDLSPNPER